MWSAKETVQSAILIMLSIGAVVAISAGSKCNSREPDISLAVFESYQTGVDLPPDSLGVYGLKETATDREILACSPSMQAVISQGLDAISIEHLKSPESETYEWWRTYEDCLKTLNGAYNYFPDVLAGLSISSKSVEAPFRYDRVLKFDVEVSPAALWFKNDQNGITHFACEPGMRKVMPVKYDNVSETLVTAPIPLIGTQSAKRLTEVTRACFKAAENFEKLYKQSARDALQPKG